MCKNFVFVSKKLRKNLLINLRFFRTDDKITCFINLSQDICLSWFPCKMLVLLCKMAPS
jgi:hypothetical protein